MKSDLVKSKFLAKSKKKSVLNKIADFFSHSQYRAYIVGGYVRDLIMELGSRDIDVTVEGNAIKAAAQLNQRLKGTLKTHPGFGTASIETKNQRVDLTTARTEYYPRPAALPLVKPASLCNDLKRRDFTINAIAVSLSRSTFGKLCDPYHGIDDIRAQQVRILHPQSFIDDPTRIFRALRYKHRLGFRLESKTKILMKEAIAAHMIERLTGQRILNEIRLVFEETHYHQILRDMSKFGIYRMQPAALKMLARMGNLKFYYYLSAISAKNLPVTAKDKKIVGEITRLPRIIARLRSSTDSIILYNTLKGIPDEIIKAIPDIAPELKNKIKRYFALTNIKPLLTGADLKRAGLKPGPLFKRKLNLILELQIKGKVKNRQQAFKVLSNDR